MNGFGKSRVVNSDGVSIDPSDEVSRISELLLSDIQVDILANFPHNRE